MSILRLSKTLSLNLCRWNQEHVEADYQKKVFAALPRFTTVVFAAKDIHANSTVSADELSVKTVSVDRLPANALQDPYEALSRTRLI